MKLRPLRDRIVYMVVVGVLYSLQLICAAWLGVRLLIARLKGFFR